MQRHSGSIFLAPAAATTAEEDRSAAATANSRPRLPPKERSLPAVPTKQSKQQNRLLNERFPLVDERFPLQQQQQQYSFRR